MDDAAAVRAERDRPQPMAAGSIVPTRPESSLDQTAAFAEIAASRKEPSAAHVTDALASVRAARRATSAPSGPRRLPALQDPHVTVEHG